MKITKPVTEKRLAANRQNAKRSTGPRTERGKNTSRFNAVKNGLFAQHVVIPRIDDDYKDLYANLVGTLWDQFLPVGPIEEFYVALMAEDMWKVRRAQACEKGVVRQQAFRRDSPPNTLRMCEPERAQLQLLKEAQKEIESTGKISAVTYDRVFPLLYEESQSVLAEQLALIAATHACDGLRVAALVVDEHLLDAVKDAIKGKNQTVDMLFRLGDEIAGDFIHAHALPQDADMEKLFRYRKAAMKQFESAKTALLETQETRKTTQGLS